MRLAVLAHIRHHETNYDELLGRAFDRHGARDRVRNLVDQISDSWQGEK